MHEFRQGGKSQINVADTSLGFLVGYSTSHKCKTHHRKVRNEVQTTFSMRRLLCCRSRYRDFLSTFRVDNRECCLTWLSMGPYAKYDQFSEGRTVKMNALKCPIIASKTCIKIYIW